MVTTRTQMAEVTCTSNSDRIILVLMYARDAANAVDINELDRNR
jgi:hypothetical protein